MKSSSGDPNKRFAFATKSDVAEMGVALRKGIVSVDSYTKKVERAASFTALVAAAALLIALIALVVALVGLRQPVLVVPSGVPTSGTGGRSDVHVHERLVPTYSPYHAARLLRGLHHSRVEVVDGLRSTRDRGQVQRPPLRMPSDFRSTVSLPT